MHQQNQAAVPYLSIARQHAVLGQELTDAIEEVLGLEDRWLALHRLESELATYLGVKHAVAVASGTDALTIALSVLDLPARATVVTSAFGFFATIAAILRAGGIPRFVDIDLKTFTMHTEQALSHIESGAQVILPVHLFGFAADLSPLLAINRLVIVEDAAQAIGAKRGGRAAGTVGMVGALSFNWSKNLGAVGNGGALVTNDDQIARRARVFSNYGMSHSFSHTVVGLNSRMDPMEAAILSVKLRHVDAWNERRVAIAARYGNHLGSVAEVQIPKADCIGTHVFHKYAILARNRNRLQAHLAERGIETMVFYPLAQHRQPCLVDLNIPGVEEYPNTDSVVGQILCLPIFPELTDAEVDYVSECIADFYREH